MSDKMNKEAFTLIELLAVIVILAIISLIAVPIILNIINDSKKSSDEQSVELYLDNVKKAITKKQLNNPNFNPDKCEIQDNGDLKCYENNELIDTLQIEMKGKMPNKGKITILNNKFNYKNIWFNNKKYYAIATLLSDADNNKEISIGDKYSYKVNDKDTFNFYVLSFNEDDTVNLIMDRNICEDGTPATSENTCSVYWNEGFTDNGSGPTSAMAAIGNATKNWENVPDIVISYQDESNRYGKILTENGITKIYKKDNETVTAEFENLKARLPMRREARGCGISWPSSRAIATCETFIVDNLQESETPEVKEKYKINSHIDNITEYLLLSAYSYSTFPNFVYYVSSYGGNIDYSGGYGGIRPVITVRISDLSN